ncbi:DUF1648 domain-containing protein [Paenibacillus psychroresistens]|uniref:DUF1648 domain-containing protein n=1 Tax=Paenibacillus psychroresistens TaxID=1778678 RepID=A0A6B8RCP7_9BACL|nr:DUF1648 domain-containing protein [Paenibacillus psychroresistens]QGQ94251.1 DUF1648 domain-containing protein [Paenibacillus psychroresistens]
MNRPIISIPRTEVEFIHTIVSIAAILFTITYLVMTWTELPNSIPIHFNSLGKVDRWGSRYVLFILPLLSLAVYFGLSILAKFPHKYNYPVQITAGNAKKQYLNGRILLSWMKVEIVVLFSYIEWRIIQTALERLSGLGILFYVILIIFIMTIFNYLLRMRK